MENQPKEQTQPKSQETGKKQWEWYPNIYDLKVFHDDSYFVWNCSPYIMICPTEPPDSDPELVVNIEMRRIFKWTPPPIGWNWHKSWNIPRIVVSVSVGLHLTRVVWQTVHGGDGDPCQPRGQTVCCQVDLDPTSPSSFLRSENNWRPSTRTTGREGCVWRVEIWVDFLQPPREQVSSDPPDHLQRRNSLSECTKSPVQQD